MNKQIDEQPLFDKFLWKDKLDKKIIFAKNTASNAGMLGSTAFTNKLQEILIEDAEEVIEQQYIVASSLARTALIEKNIKRILIISFPYYLCQLKSHLEHCGKIPLMTAESIEKSLDVFLKKLKITVEQEQFKLNSQHRKIWWGELFKRAKIFGPPYNINRHSL